MTVDAAKTKNKKEWNNAVSQIFRDCVEQTQSQFQTYGIEAKPLSNTWSPFGSEYDGIGGQKYDKNSSVLLFCQPCRKAGKVTVVCQGTFRLPHPDKSDSKYHMEINKVFFHGCKCQDGHSTELDQFKHSGYVVVDLPGEHFLGDTFNAVEERLNTTKLPAPIWAPSIPPKDRKAYQKEIDEKMTKSGFRTVEILDEKVALQQKLGATIPFGKSINFGSKTYDFDNRHYSEFSELLSSIPDEINKEGLESFTGKMLFMLIATFKLEEQLAPFKADINLWKECRKRTKSSQNAKRNLFQKNVVPWMSVRNQNECHLYPNEWSLLFGGRARRVCGPEPVHQLCHQDGETDAVIKENDSLRELFPPISIIAPIQDSRTVYFKNLDLKITVKKGQVLVFRGDMWHGGLTYFEDKWYPAIHGHVDSHHHKRMKKNLAFGTSRDTHYLHPAQLQFLPQSEQIKHLKICEKELTESLGALITNTNDVVRDLDPYTQNLVGFLAGIKMPKGREWDKIKGAVKEGKEFGDMNLNPRYRNLWHDCTEEAERARKEEKEKVDNKGVGTSRKRRRGQADV
jgi:hypothetical protein